MPADPRTLQRPMSRGWEPPPPNPATWTPAPEPAPKPVLTAKQHRARLAEVVDAFQAAADRLAKLNTAHERARRDSADAFLAIESAEGILAEAKEGQPRAYVERILANGAAGPPADLVAAAEKK